MYVTLPGITNGQSIQLLHTIDNSAGQLEVALCDVTYYPRWTNISAAINNNWLRIQDIEDSNNRIGIPDGYYSVCSLNGESFKPFGHSFTQNESNGMLKLSIGEEELLLEKSLAYTLGFLNEAGVGSFLFQPNATRHGVKLPDLFPY